MLPQDFFLRLFLGHFLVHVHILANTLQEVMPSCITEGKVVVIMYFSVG